MMWDAYHNGSCNNIAEGVLADQMSLLT